MPLFAHRSDGTSELPEARETSGVGVETCPQAATSRADSMNNQVRGAAMRSTQQLTADRARRDRHRREFHSLPGQISFAERHSRGA